MLKGYKEVATNAGVTAVETRLEFGSPKAIIPKKLAADVEADLIMCGTSGLNAVERFIVGSVSEAMYDTLRVTCWWYAQKNFQKTSNHK